MTQLPLIMQCTDKGSMVQAQYCSEWSQLRISTFGKFLCSEKIDEWRHSLYTIQSEKHCVVSVAQLLDFAKPSLRVWDFGQVYIMGLIEWLDAGYRM